MRLSLTLLVFALPLAAQQPDSAFHLKPVVVTATLVPAPSDAVPAAVTVISGDALRARGVRTVADALRFVPGASVVESGSFGSQTSLFLRGGESDYVKVLIDGVPQNLPGGSFDFANLTTADIDRIEIVRGPVSVLYGSDAVTGVIQIFTRAGRGASRGQVGFGGGTYAAQWAGGDLGGGTGPLSYGVSLSRFTSDGIYAFNNEYRNGTASARLRFAPDARTDASLSARYADGVYHFPTDGGGQPTDSNQSTTARGPSLGIDAGRVLSARVAVRGNLGWTEAQNRYDDATFAYHSKDITRRLAAGARADVRPSAATVVTVGAEYAHESQAGSSLDTARRNSALFAQLLTGTTGPLSFTLGARIDDNQQFGTHGTGRAGMVWRLDERTRARAAAGTGFKEPTLLENFGTSSFARGNPNLQPEQSASWEVGLEHTPPGDHVTVAVTYFHERFRELVQYSGAPLGPDSVNFYNVPGARVQGIEVGIQGTIGAAMTVAVSYAYLESRDTAGQRLQRRPTNAGSLRLDYALRDRGSVSLATVFTGDRDDYDYAPYPAVRVTLPPHTRVDLSGSYALSRGRGAWPGLALNARVENLFDAKYQDIRNFPARGRTLLFGGAVNVGH
ncbi:MAG TPA: TonB-dependent receptor [Gemmatimonadales bacterium]|nr:TonB-dependent receptor [Gemmatimonadales bacterium]